MSYTWTSAPLSSNYLSWFAMDKPLLVGLATNALASVAPPTMGWWETNNDSGTPQTNTATPSSRVVDGFVHQQCTTISADTTTYYFQAHQQDSGLYPSMLFDSVFILGHNFYDIGVTSVELGIADDHLATSNYQMIYLWSGAAVTAKKLVALALDHTGGGSLRAYRAKHIFIKVMAPSNFAPAIGELVLGTRRQLKHAPAYPWDQYNSVSESKDTRSYAGIISRSVLNRGARKMKATFTPNLATTRQDLLDFWRIDTACGTQPFMWVDNPLTVPGDAFLMMPDLSRSAPWDRKDRITYELAAEEQGPYFVWGL